jgi:hypothetical protein
VVTELYNIGTISGGAGLNSYGILNDGGSIEKLANAQGGNAPALTYFGDLPQNYTILITGPGTYGQLAVQSATSAQSMTVGIESTATQGLSTGQYANVITGVHAENITNAGSVFNLANGVIATLIPNQDPSATAWDARILNYGADIVEPQHTLLDRNASVLRAQIRNYDCERFASWIVHRLRHSLPVARSVGSGRRRGNHQRHLPNHRKATDQQASPWRIY